MAILIPIGYSTGALCHIWGKKGQSGGVDKAYRAYLVV